MSGNLEMLDVLIGLATIYLSFSIICTSIVEIITAITKRRSKHLETAFKIFFEGNNYSKKKESYFLNEFKNHPLIVTLSKNKKRFPSYISSETVGQVIDLLITEDGKKDIENGFSNFSKKNCIDLHLKKLLTTLINESNNKRKKFRKAVEKHFDEIMDRTTGWFKRYTQIAAGIIALLLVFTFNIDTIEIINKLTNNSEISGKVVKIGEKLTQNIDKISMSNEESSGENNPLDSRNLQLILKEQKKIISDINSSGLILGWINFQFSLINILGKIPGLLISIFAISIGAPFWFDLLQRFIQLRSSGIIPSENVKEKSKK